MTNEGWEALQKAITTARKQHESRDSTGAQDVINGALIRAVELLASQVPVETEGARAARIVNDAMETGVDPAKALISAGFPLHTQPPAERQEKSERTSDTAQAQHVFDDGLVERLAVVFGECRLRGDSMNNTIRAILSELATMDVDLPTDEETVAAWYTRGIDDLYKCENGVIELLKSRLAPVFAAQKAEIEKWRSRAFEEQHTASVRAVEGATLRKELAEARAKIDDLESRTPANEVHDSERAQYEATIKQKDERIVALANELAAQRVGHNWEAHLSNGEHEAEKARMEATIEQQRKRIEELELLTRSTIEMSEKVSMQAEKITAYAKRIAELEKRLADITTPIDATGKTPGQVAYEAWSETVTPWANMGACQAWFERAAQAVLRAFCGDALKRVWNMLGAIRTDPATVAEIMKVMESIDAELAKLEGPKPAPAIDHVHELGSCSHCDKKTPVPVVHRICKNCDKLEGMHYDPNAKADTYCCFRSKPTQNS